MHGAGDNQRDESHDRHGCFFARFMIIDSTNLRAEMHIMMMGGCRILPDPVNPPMLESSHSFRTFGHGAQLEILLTRLLACYDCIRSWYLTSTWLQSYPNLLLQQSSDRTIGTWLRARTNRQWVTRARVRWWRTLEYSILVVSMEQSDDDLHTFQIAV